MAYGETVRAPDGPGLPPPGGAVDWNTGPLRALNPFSSETRRTSLAGFVLGPPHAPLSPIGTHASKQRPDGLSPPTG